MDFTVSIVGRPNVGKSTLFNRLVGRRLALVDDTPGVTRDFREGEAQLGPHSFTLLDTAGIDQSDSGELMTGVRRVTRKAVERSDACLFLFDARSGVLPADREIAATLRRTSKPIVLVANKCEGSAGAEGLLDAHEFGLGPPVAISAEHGEGLSDLFDAVGDAMSEGTTEADEAPVGAPSDAADGERSLKIAVVGRPNAGKSSLINRILGDYRLITGSEPGTTRDAVSVPAEWLGSKVQIHDTAGMRKRSRVVEKIERLSVADALAAVRFAETVILVLDAAAPLEVQDLRIADIAEQEGRPVVVAVNKWDTIRDRRQRFRAVKERLDDRLPSIRGTPAVPVSALTGEGMEELHAAVTRMSTIWNQRISTGRLNRWLEEMTNNHPPPAVRGKTIRFRYITQAKTRPPSFVAMCSHPRHVPNGYRRYLKNGLRQSFGLPGTPIRIYLRSQSEKNPFAPKSG